MQPMPVEHDRGLQPERTHLAWSRTLYVLMIDSALFIRLGWLKHHPVLICAGVVLLCLGGLIVGVIYLGAVNGAGDRLGLSLLQKKRLFQLITLTLLVVSCLAAISVLYAA